MGRETVVPGEPAVWLGSGEALWRGSLATAVAMPEVAPRGFTLDFRVRSFTRNSHHFDVDNLATPVFEALPKPRGVKYRRAVSWWRATLAHDATSSLSIAHSDEDAEPLSPPGARLIVNLPRKRPFPAGLKDDRGFFAEVVRHIGDFQPEDHHRFAVEVAFSLDVLNVTDPSGAPIKAIVDCLQPVFGGPRKSGHDWKIRLAQMRRTASLAPKTFQLKVWLLATPGDPMPSDGPE